MCRSTTQYDAERITYSSTPLISLGLPRLPLLTRLKRLDDVAAVAVPAAGPLESDAALLLLTQQTVGAPVHLSTSAKIAV